MRPVNPYSNPGPQLVVTTPTGRMSHPLDGIDVRTVIARLAPIVPPTAVWHVDPGSNR